jgi:hypothetical protein
VGKIGVYTVIFLLFSLPSFALQNCNALSRQLNAMVRAQKSLLQSMVKKNDVLANTLDQYAQDFKSQGGIKKSDIKSLHQSAKSFRGHSRRELILVKRFESKTNQLIAKISACLKARSVESLVQR